MDLGTYAVEAEVEATHWWFTGRRRLFTHEMRRAGIASDARVLDIGTSTGTNLRMLSDLGFQRVIGLDVSEEAIRFCEAKGLAPVRQGNVCALPFPDSSFDFVLATDIIEHVDDDSRALDEIRRVLSEDGKLLLTVPAFQSLWGLQDRVSHHKRRYRLDSLLDRMRRVGLRPVRYFYFNYLLFIPIWLARRLIDLLGIELQSEGQLNTRTLNWVLSGFFSLDIRTAPILRPPFGVSIFVLSTKETTA